MVWQANCSNIRLFYKGLFFIVRTICKASQQDCVKSLSIFSSSKPTNGIVQNLYRFLIDLLPLKNVSGRSLPNLSLVSFPTRDLGPEPGGIQNGLLTSEILRDTGKSSREASQAKLFVQVQLFLRFQQRLGHVISDIFFRLESSQSSPVFAEQSQSSVFFSSETP